MRLDRALEIALLAGGAVACSDGPAVTAQALDISLLPEVRVTERAVLRGFGLDESDTLGAVGFIALLTGQEAMAVSVGTNARQEILRYSLDGELLGGTGPIDSLPGDLTPAWEMRGSPDGMLQVWDPLQSGVVTLGADLSPVHEQQADLEPLGGKTLQMVDFLPDGGYLLREEVSRTAFREVPLGFWRDTIQLHRFSGSGQFLDTVVVVEGEPQWQFRDSVGMGGTYRPVFGTWLRTLVVNDEVWVGSTRDVAFTRYALNGDVLGRIELEGKPRLASDEEIGAERDRRIRDLFPDSTFLTLLPAGQTRGLFLQSLDPRREAIRQVPSRDTLPAYDRVVSGARGLVLLREYPRPEDILARWVLLDGEGSPMGKVTLPRRAWVRAASPEILLIVEGRPGQPQVIRVLNLHL